MTARKETALIPKSEDGTADNQACNKMEREDKVSASVTETDIMEQTAGIVPGHAE